MTFAHENPAARFIIHPRLKFDFIHTKFLYRYDLLFPEFLLKLLGLLKFLISVSIECPP
jgi:hypothetical protein